MTFQAVIILTCDFWFVFGSFLAGEQALQLWRAKRTGRERASEGGGPSHWRACSQAIFFLCHSATVLLWTGSFLRLFSRLKRRKDETKKRAPEREKVSIVCQGRKPLRAGTQDFIDGPVFFSLYEMPMSSPDHKNAYIFQRKIQLVAMSKSWKIQFCEQFWPLNKSWPFNDRGSICNASG